MSAAIQSHLPQGCQAAEVAIDARSAAAAIAESLRSVGTRERAESEQRYLKSELCIRL